MAYSTGAFWPVADGHVRGAVDWFSPANNAPLEILKETFDLVFEAPIPDVRDHMAKNFRNYKPRTETVANLEILKHAQILLARWKEHTVTEHKLQYFPPAETHMHYQRTFDIQTQMMMTYAINNLELTDEQLKDFGIPAK